MNSESRSSQAHPNASMGNGNEKFMQLMRIVLHHVADEETVLLPAAETLLKDELGELGASMAKRKMQLLRPHARAPRAG